MKKQKKKLLKAKIISNLKIAPEHYVMKVFSSSLSKIAQPGQFVNVKVNDRGTDPLLRIPLGIHSINKNGITLLYKVVGEATRILSSKKKNEIINILGPLGNGFDLSKAFSPDDKEPILIAGGHGVAPLYAAVESFLKKRKKPIVFIGASTKKNIVCDKKFKKKGIRVEIATEDGTQGKKGYVTCLLKKYIRKNAKKIIIYACGPRPMLSAVSKEAKKKKIETQVSLDAYMACGVGACKGCAVYTKKGYKLVCKDGPVFNAEDIVWEKATPC